MAIPTSIKTLLDGNVVEWARIEFKETWDPEASLKTICAFANDIDNWGGGYIVIGVREERDNSKTLVGVHSSKVDAILKDMFNKCKRIRPEYMPYAQIDIVQFPDGLGGDRIIENTFQGPLHQQLRSALQYIQSVIIQEKIIKHPDRAEADRFYNYPFAAIEEALSNAVYHKGYDVREPIEVRVLPDEIEIVSYPGPDRSITRKGLAEYRVFNRRYRNRRIGEFLKEMHFTEGRNTGFRKILNALETNGSPKPLFETDDDRLSFTSTIFIHPAFLESSETKSETENETENDGLNDVEKAVLQYFKRHPQSTILKLCNDINLSRSHVTRVIRSLKMQKLLERQGSDRKGEWIVHIKTFKEL